jgi:hypothetical protein
MFSSLPDYRHFADSALQRLGNDPERKPSTRFGGMVLNLVLLAGLWGLPLYARRIVLSDRNGSESTHESTTKTTPESRVNLSEDIIGKWQSAGANYLEFTANQQLQLIQNEELIETADYRIVGEVLEVSSFKLQPGDRDLEINQQKYRISIHGDQLALKAADKGFTPIAEKMQWEKSNLRKVLPPWHGPIIRFERADNR